jgi:hypothetical protein
MVNVLQNLLILPGEPNPRQVSQQMKWILKQVWKNKSIISRIKAFAWRFLSRAIPTGARAGKYSQHISKYCCRYGLDEDDIHLFFTCPFERGFSSPLYFCVLVENSTDNLIWSIEVVST